MDIIKLLTIVLFQSSVLWTSGATTTERHSLPIQPKGTLIVQNDFGRIQVNGWEEKHIYVRVRKIAPENKLEHVVVNIRREDDLIQVSTHFREHQKESAYLEIQVPQDVNVQVWGTHPAIEIYGVGGTVRASTLTGLITAEDLTASASLLSQGGDIHFLSTSQPGGDVLLESTNGNINCVLGNDLNLRGWLRAGGETSWGEDVSPQQGSIQRRIGAGGPLFYANSLKGNVRCRLNSPSSRTADASTAATKVSHESSSGLKEVTATTVLRACGVIKSQGRQRKTSKLPAYPSYSTITWSPTTSTG